MENISTTLCRAYAEAYDAGSDFVRVDIEVMRRVLLIIDQIDTDPTGWVIPDIPRPGPTAMQLLDHAEETAGPEYKVRRTTKVRRDFLKRG